MPNIELENSLEGIVAGIDEAGRGPWAGPVVAAAVILDRNNIPAGINDSKKVSAAKRNFLYDKINASAKVGVGIIGVELIDKLNILGATKMAMAEAVRNLIHLPDFALVDGNQMPALPCKAIPVVGGDGKSLSIAAASIIAKVTRDRIMHALHEQHPHYLWNKNSGYGTKQHIEALQIHGVTEHHRKSFAPIRELLREKIYG